jgi:hypothetical protein
MLRSKTENVFMPLLRHYSLPFMVKIDVSILSSLLFIALLGEICRRQVKYALCIMHNNMHYDACC